MAAGAYALTQAVLMIPFTLAATQWSMRVVTGLGMAIFALGTLAVPMAQDLSQLAIARAVQGSGAVTGIATLALASAGSARVSAGAVTASFTLSLLLGPFLFGTVGFSGMLWVLGGAVVLGTAATWTAAPSMPLRPRSEARIAAIVEPVIVWPATLASHFILMACFAVVPSVFESQGLSGVGQGVLYALLMICAVVLSGPILNWGEPVLAPNRVVAYSAILLTLGCAALAAGTKYLVLFVPGLISVLVGYQTLTTLLPELAAAQGQSATRSIGVYAALQGFGLFAGAAAGNVGLTKWGTGVTLLGMLVVAAGLSVLSLSLALKRRRRVPASGSSGL